MNYSFAWICSVCDSKNIAQRSSTDTSDISLTTTESSQSSEQDVSIQDHSIDLDSCQTYDDIPCSTPKKRLQGLVKQNSLSCIVVNTESILSKKKRDSGKVLRRKPLISSLPVRLGVSLMSVILR